MTQWKVESAEAESGTLGKLEPASHIYAFDGYGSTYTLVSTDPAYPFIMSTHFQSGPGYVSEELEAFLSDRPHTIVMRDVGRGKTYSPNGRYYLKGSGDGVVIYDTVTNKVVSSAAKSGYSTYPLAWAADSSGMYVRFSPNMSMGQYLNHFMYKLLVPGAVKQEPPTFTTVPFGESSQLDAGAFVAADSEKRSSTSVYISLLMIGGIGIVISSQKRRAWGTFWSLFGLTILLASCMTYGPSSDYDYNRLDLTGGDLELVISAEQGVTSADLSPDGRWLAMAHYPELRPGKLTLSFVNLEERKIYNSVSGETLGQWLDNEHYRTRTSMIRVSDMVQWELERIDPPKGSLGLLEGADHIYAVDGFASTYSLTSTDPAFPYVMHSKVTNAETELLLAGKPYTILDHNMYVGNSKYPIYSPDGQYYVLHQNFDDPTHKIPSPGGTIYARDGQEIGYGYKYGWNTIFLGWAHDGSGAYFRYHPRTPDGDVLYRKYPIYKVLLPGAEKQEPLNFVPAVTEESSQPDTDTSVAAGSKNGNSVLYRPIMQTGGNSGWYIDDLLVEEAPVTPTPMPTVINTATATPVSTATPPTPTNTPPPPTITPAPQSWQNQDIGAVLAAGSTVEQNGTFTINGSGDNIWNDDDAFQYAYQPVSGDGTIIARVVSQEDTGDYAKAGIMFRESLDSDSYHAMTSVTPSEGTRLQYRDGDGSSLINNPGYAAPIWLKLERNGALFTGYRSSDGVTWSEIGQHTVGMGTDIYVGLAVNAFDIDDNGTLSEIVFDNVTIDMSGSSSTPTCDPLPAAWVNQDVGSTAAAGTACYSSDDEQFTLNGSGDNIWNDDDAFQYAYQTLDGDGSITTRVVSQENTGDYAKAGVMFRESLDSNSKHAMTSVTPTEGTRLQYRDGDGSGLINNPGYAAPIWVRLVRVGDVFTAYRSSDGVTWSEVGQHTVTMGTSIHVGLAVTAFDDGALSEVLFDNVVITDD